MRGLLIFALVAGWTSLPVNAQRTMHAGHAGGFAAPRMGGGFHFASPPSFTQRSYPLRFTGVPQYRNRTPYNSWHYPSAPDWSHGYRPPYRDRGHRYRRPYVPYFYANSTYLVPGLLNSWLDWPYYDDFDHDAGTSPQNYSDQTPSADYSNEEQQQRPEYSAENVPPPPPATSAPQEPLKQAAVTLVFKDGHTQQVRNYAMTATTLYVLDEVASSGRRLEIPLSSLDFQATQRANHQAGVDFALPAN